MPAVEAKNYHIDALREFSTRIFLHFGVPKDDATQAADVLASADLRGIDSHGVARLYSYFGLLNEGLINPKPKIATVRSTLSTATIDGENGLGLVVGPHSNPSRWIWRRRPFRWPSVHQLSESPAITS